jgi:hypothetical protein
MADLLEIARRDATKARDTRDPAGAALRSLEARVAPVAWALATGHVAPAAGTYDSYSTFDEHCRRKATEPPGLDSWLDHVRRRHGQLKHWPPGGLPPSVWLPGLFRPAAFFAALRRARVDGPPVMDAFACTVLPFSASAVEAPPTRGAFVHGLRLEGGLFDDSGILDDDLDAYQPGRDGGRHVHRCLWVRPIGPEDYMFGPGDNRPQTAFSDVESYETASLESAPLSVGTRSALSSLRGSVEASSYEAPSRPMNSVDDTVQGPLSGPVPPPPSGECPPTYDCPMYRSRVRDDFVTNLRVLSSGPADHWTLRGCALICGEVDM